MSQDYKYRVTGPRGGKYLTTTRKEAEALTKNGGSIKKLKSKASKAKNPKGKAKSFVTRNNWNNSHFSLIQRLDDMVEQAGSPPNVVGRLRDESDSRFFRAPPRGSRLRPLTFTEAQALWSEMWRKLGRRKNPSCWVAPPRVAALFAETRVSKGELREIFPEWFDGKGNQSGGFFRITIDVQGEDGKAMKVGLAIPFEAKLAFAREWRGITKHWGFRRKESFADIKKSLMLNYYLDVLKLCKAGTSHPFDTAMSKFLGQMESYTKRSNPCGGKHSNPGTGRSWDSREGRKTITGKHPSGAWMVTVEGQRFPLLVQPQDLEGEIAWDTKAAASWKKARGATAAAAAVKSAAKAAYDDVQGFTEGMAPHQRARALAALNKSVMSGKRFLTRKALIAEKVQQGAKIGHTKTFGDVLETPNGSFLAQKDITKTGMNYAKHLIEGGHKARNPSRPKRAMAAAYRRRAKKHSRRSNPGHDWAGQGLDFGHRYLDTFFAEKDLPIQTWTVKAPNGTAHVINSQVVLEHVAMAGKDEQDEISRVIRKIDFANGDVNHFLHHLAGAIAANYASDIF